MPSHSLGGKEEEEEDNLPLTHHQALSRGLALCSVLYVHKSSEPFLQHFEEDIISPTYSHLPKAVKLVSGAAGIKTQVSVINQSWS